MHDMISKPHTGPSFVSHRHEDVVGRGTPLRSKVSERRIGGDNPILGYCPWISTQTIRFFAELDHETSHAMSGWFLIQFPRKRLSLLSRVTARPFRFTCWTVQS